MICLTASTCRETKHHNTLPHNNFKDIIFLLQQVYSEVPFLTFFIANLSSGMITTMRLPSRYSCPIRSFFQPCQTEIHIYQYIFPEIAIYTQVQHILVQNTLPFEKSINSDNCFGQKWVIIIMCHL